MERDEIILLAVVFGALAAVVLWQVTKPVGGGASSPEPATNLTYNQPGLMFAAPVANVMPQHSAGGSIDAAADPFMNGDCGCWF